ncbi:MAG: hypothetical protein ACD_3C00042G0001 [uncultured bacterium (gcode 4)]|uniref:Uncharacterized protein n=1 Tax=uncultured bacterium (gcode 4) TaxID=1234023 RepID=K2FBV6_9BACT|nr:MAG: hypothetical protein ACD_3C00042G0001 [uncultured bacterium (gcode 4)]
MIIRIVCIITVFTILDYQWNDRNIFDQFIKLLEESSIEIKFSSIFKRIPFIWPPFRLFISFIWFIRWIYRDDIFSSQIAFSSI